MFCFMVPKIPTPNAWGVSKMRKKSTTYPKKKREKEDNLQSWPIFKEIFLCVSTSFSYWDAQTQSSNLMVSKALKHSILLRMAHKALVMAVLISTLLLMAAYNAEGEEGSGTSAMCLDDCVRMCMKLERATKSSCDQGCMLGCKQLRGKGPSKPVATASDL